MAERLRPFEKQNNSSDRENKSKLLVMKLDCWNCYTEEKPTF